MFEHVEMIETKDGNFFSDEKQAENYVTDEICAEMNEWIKSIETYDLKHRDLTAILMEFAGTKENVIRLYKLLNKYI